MISAFGITERCRQIFVGELPGAGRFNRPLLKIMKLKLAVVPSLFACLFSGFSQQNKPLRVFIRASVKTHGPNQHDHPPFLAEWKDLLNQRAATADASIDFPTSEQLDSTDVRVIH